MKMMKLKLSVMTVFFAMLLGLAVITIALVIWTAVFLICDPNGVVRSALLKKKS